MATVEPDAEGAGEHSRLSSKTVFKVTNLPLGNKCLPTENISKGCGISPKHLIPNIGLMSDYQQSHCNLKTGKLTELLMFPPRKFRFLP